MASIKVKFRPASTPEQEGTIFYQIIHERKQRQYVTDYHVYPNEWNEKRSTVVTTANPNRKSFILSIKERLRWDMERICKIIRHFDEKGLDYTVNDIVDEFQRFADECSIFNYMESIIIKLKQNGKIRTAETYSTSLNTRVRDKI